MIKENGELRLELIANLKGGDETIRVLNILEADEMFGTGRLFGVSIIPPGGSIGPHFHEGDFETYFILEGTALVNDNGNKKILRQGDMTQCSDGHFHSIKNAGVTDLKYLAVILFSR